MSTDSHACPARSFRALSGRCGPSRCVAGLAIIVMLLATSMAAAQAQNENSDVDSTVAPDVDTIVVQADKLIATGDHDAAIELLEQGLETIDPGNHTGRALLHSRLAIGHYYRRDVEGIGQHADAAIELVADDPDAIGVYADALSARALYFGESGQTEAYLETSKTELAVRRQLPPAESEISSPLINIAIAHGETGNFEAAERYLREALDYAREYESETIRPTMIRSNLAWVYGMRKDFRDSARMLRTVIATGRENAPGSVNLAMRLANLGSILRSLQRYSEAREALQEALALQREQIPDSVDIARTTFALGQVAQAKGDKAQAERLYRESIDIIDARTPNSPGAALPRRALAGLLIDRGELSQAETLLTEAEAMTGPTNNPGHHASTLFQLGRLQIERGNRHAARELWRKAIDTLERQYNLLGGSALTMASFSEAYEPLYRSLAQLLIDEGDYGKAIRLLESYRNRALLERLDVNRILRRSEAGGQLVSDLDELGDQARSIMNTDDPSGSVEATPQERLARLARQRRARVAEAIRQQPRLAELLESDTDWRPGAAALEEGQRILYYSLGKERSDLIVIAPDGITARRLPSASEIAALVERFRILVQRPEADPAPLSDVSRRLSEVLLEPASEQLADAESLLLRADGALLLLPFAALRDSDNRYLVEGHRIHRLHTLDSESRLSAEIDQGSADFSGFAYAGNETGNPGLRGNRVPLRYVSEEIERAAAVFGERARRHVGDAATETQARSIGGNRIVHFASHAVADAVQPLSSFISLAEDNDHDGRLELWEVMADLQLDGGLVVLSACETALGPSFAGEGLFGLAKGFAFAGAESVIASLWAVDDASTLHLMEAFYLELAAGRSPDEALRHAQQTMLSGEIPNPGWVARLFGADRNNDFSHPYYWAAFTLTTTR